MSQPALSATWCERILESHGVPPDEAAIVADVLVRADLRGVESHGVARLEQYYVRAVCAWAPMPAVSPAQGGARDASHRVHGWRQRSGTRGGQASHGPVPCQGPGQSGLAAVTVNHSNHFGIAGYYAMMALPHDMIGVALTNASSTVVPTYSRQRLLGTNPIAIAVPAGEERPFVLDMATTVAAEGKIEVKDRQGKPLRRAGSWTRRGDPSTRPEDFLRGRRAAAAGRRRRERRLQGLRSGPGGGHSERDSAGRRLQPRGAAFDPHAADAGRLRPLFRRHAHRPVPRSGRVQGRHGPDHPRPAGGAAGARGRTHLHRRREGIRHGRGAAAKRHSSAPGGGRACCGSWPASRGCRAACEPSSRVASRRAGSCPSRPPPS